MSRKGLQKEMCTEATTLQGNDDVPRKEPPVFYRCTCPECGEDAMELRGHGVFFRADLLGVTHDGDFGCGYMELDGDYHWVIECGECGYTAFDTDMLPPDPLIDCAAASGKAIKQLEFTCPVCESDRVEKVYLMSRSVRALYETSDNEAAEPHAEAALSFEQAIDYGESVRYCCHKGHELTKEDGNPVQTDEDLFEWMKAHQTSDN